MTTNPALLTYAYTQTLATRFYKLSAIEQFTKAVKIIRKNIKECCEQAHVIPELTHKSNIHFHGILVFIDKESMHRFNDLGRSLGFSLLKPIFNLEVWMTYMRKEYEETKKYLNVNITYVYKRKECPILVDPSNLRKILLYYNLSNIELDT